MHKLTQILLEATITPRAAACKKDVLNHFGQNTFAGVEVFNYRTQRGSSSMSQHAFGNAIDFRVSKPAITKAEKITDEQKRLGDNTLNYLLDNADRFAIQNIIWFKKIYSRPSFQARNYNGVSAHYDHVHVDFVPQTQKDFDKSAGVTSAASINKYMVGVINSYYKISTIDPESYFEEFRSWNPISKGIGDDEEGASNKLISRFLKIYEPKLNELEQNSSISYEDKENIQTIRKIVYTLNDAILDGKSIEFSVPYFKFIPSSGKYQNNVLIFKWNYL
jgi:hypothetical protein